MAQACVVYHIWIDIPHIHNRIVGCRHICCIFPCSRRLISWWFVLVVFYVDVKGYTQRTLLQRSQRQGYSSSINWDSSYKNLSDFQSYQLVYVDESECNKRVRFRRIGWSPLGIPPMQVSQFHRDQGCQILPTYSQDGIVFSRIFRGSTDTTVFEDFIAQLLQHYGRQPEPKSVLVIDNASFYHSERMTQMYIDIGVKLVYLPPYSPDLNPIEEFFAKLKAFIKRSQIYYEVDPD